MPKRGKLDFLVRIHPKVINMMGCEDPPRLNIFPYPYATLDWRGCPNILFTQDEPTGDRGKFNVMFELI